MLNNNTTNKIIKNIGNLKTNKKLSGKSPPPLKLYSHCHH